ncbi:polysaccharide pyruvyl transferase family protein [Acinetobacter variabilis]|uniref:polysaccharide pyruvyl transferase family protein n=1 Tax=Acinetobacter variabilis TaxID=70346 RepID=UPI0021CD6D16|nr:polysaccharide pyruvyl transferase family protein [Acinetobacter variabilis]MCU4364238.1 polysaccharide pyruvyl transferase family protein [Acinetobacter variabilis]MCU4374427.1 polysaccharide pyruvyl transferase family protein [Acinetobacter variabilis]
MFNYIKKVFSLKLKQHIFTILNSEKVELPVKKRLFIFLAADYGNIGDLAISAAQKKFLEENLLDYEVFPVPISKTRLWLDSIKKQVKSEDIITIIGGGNMGSLYPDIEDLRQLVIRSFPYNKIVCFPQTLDWDESQLSNKALKKIVKTYSAHSDIHIFARELITYKKLEEVFNGQQNVKIGFVPDIVMSTSAKQLGVVNSSRPTGILTCLRNDKECALKAEHYAILDSAIGDTGLTITKTDTHAGGSGLSKAECNKLLSNKIQQFAEARLVITDRLHGMILCMLSGTPCLVLPNSNHKIRQTYLDWLKNHPRLIFVELENFTQVSKYIDQLLSQPRGNLIDSPVELTQYKPLIKALSEK